MAPDDAPSEDEAVSSEGDETSSEGDETSSEGDETSSDGDETSSDGGEASSDDDGAPSSPADRVIVLDVVGLREEHLADGLAPNLAELLEGGSTAPLEPPFPAVTVPVQTTLATGQSPAAHADVSNGEYDRERDAAAFWERDRADRTRLWEAVSDEAGLTTGALFFQHLIGTSADVAITPSPIEDENNDMIEMDCWTNPDGFYDALREAHGHFPLHQYWGPGAGAASSEWILESAREAIERYDPDLLWVYVPHLDYDAQRHGPDAPELHEAVETVDELVGDFCSWLAGTDRWPETAVSVVSEYSFHAVDRPVFPNRALRDAGLLAVRDDGEGGEEVDLPASDAFAMVDHQVAHVYADESDAARDALAPLEGVEAVLDEAQRAEYGVDHPNAGDLVLLAESDAWFQYYWWDDHDDAPYYATDMDIHAKPGFDPCELFVGETGLASLDPTQVSGSHGRVDEPGYGFFGLGGPAAPALSSDDAVPADAVSSDDASGDTTSTDAAAVDARAVAPTIADLLGVRDDVSMSFERASLLE